MRWVALLITSVLSTALLAGCANSTGTVSSSQACNSCDVPTASATSDTGVIRGLVVDTGIRPIANATVLLTGAARQTSTSSGGGFTFDNLKPGTYFVQVSKLGFITARSTGIDVVAGVSDPKVERITLEANPTTKPFVEPYHFHGFLACGVAVFATSIGCTIFGPVADATQSSGVWTIMFTNVIANWTQGELTWDQTQPAGGDFIWEIATPTSNNNHCGYRETTTSPALAYINNTILHMAKGQCSGTTVDFLKDGITYRFFGGPHPLCQLPPPPPPVPDVYVFGCGVTINQKAEAIVHNFYNFVPPPGWRYTNDGDPVIPQ